MFKSYVKIALRNLFKQTSTSVINILGLAIGLACSILILLFVRYELSYDKYHEKADRIYRLAVEASIGDTKIHQTHTSAITFLKILEEFPEVESGVKFLDLDDMPVIHGEKTVYEEDVLGVDSTFFEIFTVPLLSGESDQVLNKPNSMVITEDVAIKYFGRTDVVGERLGMEFSYGLGKIDFEITGVSEAMPGPSHFHFNMLLSLSSFPDLINDTGWTSNRFKTYLLLKENSSRESMEEKLPEFTRKYMGGESFDEWVAKGNYWVNYLQPLKEIHLKSDLNGEFEPNGNKTYVYIFSVLSIIILLIACINFMNLSTAKSSLRAREVGLRKVVGSRRIKLIRQFLSESVILSFIALILGLILVESLLPAYRNFVGRPIEFSLFNNIYTIPSLLLLGLIVGLVSGSYPAFVLSSFNISTILKGKSGSKRSGIWLRNVLVVIQFSISIFLIIGTITIYRQMKYFMNKNLGFKKEQVLVIHNHMAITDNIDSFKDELKTQSGALYVSGSNTLPGEGFSNWGFGAEGVENSFTLNSCICDYDYLDALQMKIIKGRFFSRDFPTDSAAAILNKKAAELLGYEDPIGKQINNWAQERGNFKVIGVIDDYHYESLHQEIRPMAMFLIGGYFKNPQSFISLRYSADHPEEIIKHTEKTWKSFAPDKPFEYSFLDEDYEHLYTNEKQTRKLFAIFSLLAIFIACLGLFGLASFVADQKTKEIGIRKVMGASVTRIVQKLNLNFTIWVIIANLIAWPAAWYFMKQWLQNFAYRVDLNIWSFLAASIITLVIAYLVISLQSIKAALQNPVDSLRYE